MKIELAVENGEKIYLQLYYKLKELIENGEIKGKIFSIRELAKNLGVSISTVVKAYEELEKNGYIYLRGGSGAYVKYNREKKFYLEDHMENEIFKYAYFNSEYRIDFSTASPNADFFPIEELKKAINYILDRDGGKALLYENPQGYLELRKAIKKELKDDGIDVGIKDIQIMSGAQQGIDILSKSLIYPGDIVVTEDPAYKGAVVSFKNNGAKVERISMKKDGLDIKELEDILKRDKIKFIYTAATFHNPTGISISEKKRIELLELAEKYDFYIIEDDCSSDIYFDKKKIRSIKSYDKNNRVIYIKSYSKVFMPGFRLGFMVAPEKIANSVLAGKYSSDISNSGLNQRVFQYFLEKGIWNEHIEKSRKEFHKKQKYMYSRLKKIENIKINKPKGGMCFWIELPKEITGEAVYMKLAKRGVGILPGVVFSEKAYNYIRLSFAQCNEKEIDDGIEILKKVIDELR